MGRKDAYILRFTSLNLDDKAQAGEKAFVLSEIAGLGMSVPDGFVVSSKACEDFFQSNNLFPKIKQLLSTAHLGRVESLSQVSNHIQKLILDTKIPQGLRDKILTFSQKSGDFFKSVLVIYPSHIGSEVVNGQITDVKNPEELLKNIKKTWARLFEPENLSKHINRRFSPVPIIVQKMIDSDKTGKLLTSDFSMQTDARLNDSQTEELKEIGKKLKKHFYLPQIVDWAIHKNKIYVIDIKPLTNLHKAKLVLVRHGESEWNALGLWTGWTDISLSEKGHIDARTAGESLKDIHFDIAYTSALKRAQQTLDEIKDKINQLHLRTIKDNTLNERNYGDFTGKNKWEIEKEVGEEQFMKWRRGWDDPIPNGESLKDVYHRVIPYFETEILPKLKSGKNVIISAHGNSIRVLVKYLENITDTNIPSLEIAVGEVYVYTLNEEGKVVGKEIRNQHENKV